MGLLDRINVKSLSEKPISDFTSTELAALLKQKYPVDPVSYLWVLYHNKDIGKMLYNQTLLILQGVGYDKTENNVKRLSIEDSIRGRSYEIRCTNK